MGRPLLRLSLLAVVLAVLGGLPARAELAPLPWPQEETLEELEAFIEARMAEQPSAGMSVGFLLDGKTWTRGFGFRDVARKLPATPKTSYRMASVTKPMTAIAAMRLVELGKLKLDRDIRGYLPSWPKKRWRLTTRHLLGHTAGIRHYVNCRLECHHKTAHTTEQSIDIFRARALEFEPGSEYMYSSYGYNLAGAVMEQASGESYEELLHKHIFHPAGMGRSGVERDASLSVKERAAGYRVRGGELRPSERVDISSRFAGGGTRSTVEDMLRFAGAYLDGTLLSEASRREVETPMWTTDGVLTDYGLGFAVIPQSGRFVLMHGGGQPETATLLVLYPAERFAVAMAANVEGFHGVLGEVREHIVARVLGDGGRRRAPLGDSAEAAIFARGAFGLMSHGVAWYTRRGGGLTTSAGELVAAMDSLSTLLDPAHIEADLPAAREAVRFADDPVGGRVYPIAGAHMAGVIARVSGAASLRRYHDDEPFRFLLDYAAACARSDCPDAFRLAPEVVAAAERYEAQWRTTNTPEVRRLRLGGELSAAQVGEKLTASFAKAEVHPDFSREVAARARAASAEGHLEQARAWLELNVELHPESARALRGLADLHLDAGELDAARPLLERWVERVEDAPDKLAEKTLARAKVLGQAARPASARLLLELVAPTVPPASGVFDLLADVLKAAGEKEAAANALEAAQAAAPTKKRARKIRDLELGR
jgi:CubicO group peptidase (beta-lactamase class C family)